MPAEVLSPELALVCPELRAAAIAALPVRGPDPWLDDGASDRDEHHLPHPLADGEEQRPEWVAPLPVAVAAYTIQRSAKLAVELTAFLGGVAALMAIVALVRF